MLKSTSPRSPAGAPRATPAALRRQRRFFPLALLALSSVPGGVACTLLTDVDREKIPPIERPPFPEVDAGDFDAALPPHVDIDADVPDAADAAALDAGSPDATPDAAPDGAAPDAAPDAS